MRIYINQSMLTMNYYTFIFILLFCLAFCDTARRHRRSRRMRLWNLRKRFRNMSKKPLDFGCPCGEAKQGADTMKTDYSNAYRYKMVAYHSQKYSLKNTEKYNHTITRFRKRGLCQNPVKTVISLTVFLNKAMLSELKTP